MRVLKGVIKTYFDQTVAVASALDQNLSEEGFSTMMERMGSDMYDSS